MEKFCMCILFVCVVTLVTGQMTSTPACHDIDTSACKILLASKPDLCSDPAVSKSACPRFCKLCPVECYHCNATVQDYHLCNTTMLCPDGQVCMKKELKSYVDGHHEYQMTCEEKRLCDGGSDLSIPFGKRDIESRDITVTCCADDLCNYPEPTVATSTAASSCPKDIVFLVDETSTVAKSHQAGIINLIKEVVKRLEIGNTDNLVALYGYGHDIDRKFSLHQYTSKSSLLSALQSETFFTHDHHADLHDAIQTLVNHILLPRAGDRPGYPDAIVIIDDSYKTHDVNLASHDREALQKASQNIIHVGVGPHTVFLPGTKVNSLATDSKHILNVSDLYAPSTLVDSIVALLTKC